MTVDAKTETLNFQSDEKQLLQLVIHSMYSNKEIFLRELNSNASDATDKLRFEAIADPALLENDPNLAIKISFDATAKTLTISDNGIGMSRDEVVTNLGTIAKSGTREYPAQLSGDQKKDAHLIGQFGVGFYSAFIVADRVTVLTRRAGLTPEHGVKWVSSGDGSYTIENIEKTTRGTDVILHLRDSELDFLNDWRIRNIVKKYSDHLNLPIMMHQLPSAEEDKKTEETAPEWEMVNRATALWTLPKKDITEEEYQELYKHISHDFENPLMWAHNQVEGGNLDYISLLYLPARAPFDLFQPDRQHGLKLYVQRVSIMDQVQQFLPSYLRFIKGIVDTNALPLNISREILQDNPVIPKLRNALVKRILDMLDKLTQDSPEKYINFWNQFGKVLKEGPAEDFANRTRVAKLLRFATTHSDSSEQTVSFDDYIKRMKPEQKHIFYITADSFAAAKSSPHLEIFRKNNIEVLLLTDHIDEWLVSHLSEVEGKQLQSVAKGDVNLDEIESQMNTEEQKEKNEKTQTEFDEVIKQVKTILGNEVKDVRISHRLTSSPSCLVVDQQEMGTQLQRLLKAAGQDVADIKPIFELNPEHALVKKLKTLQGDSFQEWTHLLFDQAILAEGGKLKEPGLFVQRMNNLLLKS